MTKADVAWDPARYRFSPIAGLASWHAESGECLRKPGVTSPGSAGAGACFWANSGASTDRLPALSGRALSQKAIPVFPGLGGDKPSVWARGRAGRSRQLDPPPPQPALRGCPARGGPAPVGRTDPLRRLLFDQVPRQMS
jgi:hypothetical protein